MSKLLETIISDNNELVSRAVTGNDEFRSYIDSLTELPKTSDILYHYTNIDAIVNGILSSEREKEVRLRFSSYEYMNDPNEFKTGQKLLMKIFPQCDESEVENLLDWNNEEVQLILSMSLACDNLPMWNVYGNRGSGVALGFDKNELIKHVGSVELCIYNSEEFCMKIRNIANKIASDVLPNYNGNDEFEKYIAMYVNEISIPYFMSSVYVSILKDAAYSYEQEARMICRIKSGHENKVKYRSRNNLIIPYIDLKFPRSILKEVWIGPTHDMVRAKKSLRAFLDHLGFKHVQIKESMVPYRG